MTSRDYMDVIIKLRQTALSNLARAQERHYPEPALRNRIRVLDTLDHVIDLIQNESDREEIEKKQ